MDLSALNLVQPFTGEALFVEVVKSHDKRKAFAEGLIYEQTITMCAADPGAGKSTVSTQMAMELAAGVPVFGYFHVPKPCKVLYIQSERGLVEIFERMNLLKETIPLEDGNLFITDQFQKLNLTKPDHAELFLDYIKLHCPDPEIIIIDPIYSMIRGGLKDDIPASIFTNLMSVLQKQTGASLWYNHHTVKSQQNHKGETIVRDDPFYGSQWLKAHVTGSFHLKECNGGVVLDLKKDNYRILPEKIALNYDSETGMCRVFENSLSPKERMKKFLDKRKMDKKDFTFADIEAETLLCTRVVRRVTCTPDFLDHVNVVTGSKNKKIYKIKE